jgi:RimJ/RimL family protein N-acetyltransferase
MSSTIFDLQPTLEDDLIILRPLQENDFEALYGVASDPLIWEQHPARDRWQREVFEVFFRGAMESGGAFAVIDKKSGKMIGSSRFVKVKEDVNAIEIGWTFLAREYWGGVYNLSMKRLMIDHALRFVGNILFFIGENNMRSRKAVEKLGGVLITELDGIPITAPTDARVIYNLSKEVWQSHS